MAKDTIEARKAMQRRYREHAERQTGAAPDKQAAPENLDELNLDELKALAEAHNLSVVRTDGRRGKLRRADYIVALT